MKKQFEKYSGYYDTIYADKPYQKEADFILQVFKKFSPGKIKTLFSIGAGTGTFERILRKKGLAITGIDLSEKMLKIAREKDKGEKSKIDYRKGDARSFRLNKKFDAAMAMFNIVGYQNTNLDFEKFLQTAAYHLKKGGVFVFDGWYRPAVLKDPPQNRIKTVQLGPKHTLIRKTAQTLNTEKNILNITFELIEKKAGKTVAHIIEKHPMRFFTLDEISYFLRKNGFRLLKSSVFPNLNKPVSEKDWNLFIVAQRQ